MSRSKILAERIKEVLTEGDWVTGTNVLDTIQLVNFNDATRSVYQLNTVASLTYHLLYYIKGVQDVFDGQPLSISDSKSFLMPSINSESDWNNLIQEFKNCSTRFINTVATENENKWQQVFAHEKYGTFERNIDVLIEHSYYHLGQMRLILKLL